MYRLLLGSCVLAVAVLAARGDEKSAAAMKSIIDETIKELRGAGSPEGQQKALKAGAEKLVAFAQKNANTPEAIQALAVVVAGMPLDDSSKDGPKAKALALLLKDHVKSKGIAAALRQFVGGSTEEGVAVLKAVVEQHPDKATQAKAAQAVVKARDQMATIGKRLKDSEPLRERIEKQRGKAFVQHYTNNIEKFQKESRQYAKLLKEKYAEHVVDLSVGARAPEVVSQDLNGKQVKLSELRGKVVVLDIWATWCPPCKAMIPHTRELVKKMEKKPFVFVSISADAKKETLTDFMKTTPMPWTHWWNGATGGIVEAWEIDSFPTIFVLDTKGVIRNKIVGANNKAIDEAVEKLVKEAEDDKKGK